MKKIPRLGSLLLALLWALVGGQAVAGDAFAPWGASPKITRILAQAEGNSITLQMSVPPGSHVYAVHLPLGLGPSPSQVILEPAWPVPASQLSESPPQRIFDQAYETELLAHEGEFWVQVRFAQPPPRPLRGVFRYQICSQAICSLPLDAAFELK